MTLRFVRRGLLGISLASATLLAACSNPAPPAKDVTPAAKPAPAAPAKPARKADARPAEPAKPAEPKRRATTPEPAAPVATPAAPAAAPVAEVTLKVDVDVPDAQVFVDRVFVGKSPVTTTDVKPGTHRLNVAAEGFEGIAQNIDVKPGTQSVSVKLREVRLDVSIDVVHKHGMGSCKGRLIATPQGMRYDTTNKNDAFSTPLLDIDTFEVDYMAKNLRVKLKSGKRFDFTDPDGNADRLFVFQRDVDKARERLKKGDQPAQP